MLSIVDLSRPSPTRSGSGCGDSSDAGATVSPAEHGCLIQSEQIVVIAGIPREEIRQEGEAKGRQDVAASMTLRLLTRRCGSLTNATTAQIQSLPLQQLEALAAG